MKTEYIKRGYGRDFATRKEKVSRWTRAKRPQVPNEQTQLAMAAVLGIPAHEVVTRGWPKWLALGLRDDHAAWTAPWTAAGALAALDDGGPVDRRRMLIASTGTVSAVIAQWANALPALPQTSGRRIGTETADHLDTRLAALRRLDDDLGADHVYDAARAEIRLIARLLQERSYTMETGRRLWSAAAEASRLAGWCAYDNGNIGAAERHFAGSLHAAGEAGDPTAGAVAAAFWANVRYGCEHPDPGSAIDLVSQALAGDRIRSPRVVSLLLIRRARAHSVAGNASAAYRAIDGALAAYEAGVPAGEDLPSMYWITAGEILQSAGSAAQRLGDPQRALTYFAAASTHPDPYDAHEPRGAAIYEARRAEAYLALGDIDGAVETARQAVELMGGVSSARASSTLAGLHSELGRHRRLPLVAGFLDETG
ncbi:MULTISPECIES: transcriptional regulator [unclassified Streptomyces]|uniref:transcriptional regulator n=1 Tax=unclassified Streptomyces TaxID=2593676 RepID=UPI002E2E278B|nr:transcriptional regulator [Streptomyces sp. NBC_00223]